KYEHVALTEASSKKISGWLTQAAGKKKGVKIPRKGILNWLVEKMPENLTSAELNSLIERFYSEEQFLRQLLREVQESKSAGNEEPDFELVVKARKAEKTVTEPKNDSEGQ
uniref:hypothetical protein n=1 Tax=Staphylococcus epidermidis TaxID=1282 RepID=UPI00273873E1